MGCDGGTYTNNSNPNIPNYSVSFQINMDLPSYSNLKFPSNHVVEYSQGARGIVIFNTGSGYVAYDLACPNQSFATCTTAMTVTGIEAKCSCDNSIYNLFSGQSQGQQYPMKQYRVDMNGNTLSIYN